MVNGHVRPDACGVVRVVWSIIPTLVVLLLFGVEVQEIVLSGLKHELAKFVVEREVLLIWLVFILSFPIGILWRYGFIVVVLCVGCPLRFLKLCVKIEVNRSVGQIVGLCAEVGDIEEDEEEGSQTKMRSERVESGLAPAPGRGSGGSGWHFWLSFPKLIELKFY